MSVIFQLFRADDLKMLSKVQLDDLREKIIDAVKVAQQALQSHTGSPEGLYEKKSPSEEAPPEPLRLNISHQPDPSPNTPPEIRTALDRALDKRFQRGVSAA